MSEPTPPPGFTAMPSGLLMPVDLQAASPHFGDVTNSQTPSPWLVDWFQGGAPSRAGVRVSPHSSMSLAAYYACLRVIAEDCAKLPLVVYERKERGREKAADHWLWPILQEHFNDDMTAYTGREVMSHHAPGWGNAYGYIIRDRSMTRREGQVEGIYPLHPSRVRPERDPDTGGIRYRVYRAVGNRTVQDVPELVPARDMLHLKNLGPDGLVGYSMAQIAQESLGLSMAAQTYGAAFFGNSGMPSGILKHPGRLGAEGRQNVKQAWDERYGGPGGAGGTAVLEEGMSWEAISIPPEQAQFLQTRAFQIREICRWFRMQPHKIADLADAHHTNIESQNIEHVVDTMMPWHVRWEQEINRKLLAGTPYYVKHDVRALLRGDSQARSEYYRALFMVGAYSPNDILELEDMNPYEGGDERFLQIQYAPVRKIVDGTARQPRSVGAPRRGVPQDAPEAHVNGWHRLEEEPEHAS